MKRGTWQTPRLAGVDIIVLIIVLQIQAVVRAWDYLTGEDTVSTFLTVIEGAFPLEVWGGFILALATMLTVGMLAKWHIVVWASHALFGCLYFVFMVGLLIAVFTLTKFPWDGVRWGTILLTPMVLHFILALRTGPTPMGKEDSVVEETVIKDHA